MVLHSHCRGTPGDRRPSARCHHAPSRHIVDETACPSTCQIAVMVRERNPLRTDPVSVSGAVPAAKRGSVYACPSAPRSTSRRPCPELEQAAHEGAEGAVAARGIARREAPSRAADPQVGSSEAAATRGDGGGDDRRLGDRRGSRADRGPHDGSLGDRRGSRADRGPHDGCLGDGGADDAHPCATWSEWHVRLLPLRGPRRLRRRR
jgi:hypothetical protein